MRFTTRDLMWLTVACAFALCWYAESRDAARLRAWMRHEAAYTRQWSRAERVHEMRDAMRYSALSLNSHARVPDWEWPDE